MVTRDEVRARYGVICEDGTTRPDVEDALSMYVEDEHGQLYYEPNAGAATLLEAEPHCVTMGEIEERIDARAWQTIGAQARLLSDAWAVAAVTRNDVLGIAAETGITLTPGQTAYVAGHVGHVYRGTLCDYLRRIRETIAYVASAWDTDNDAPLMI